MFNANDSFLRYFQPILLIVILLMGAALYTYWQSMISQVIEWQKLFHGMLANHVQHISQAPLKHGLALIGLSFAYGVFHAVGPGHGKAVIITYLGSHKETLRRGALISLFAALLQSVVAILLIVVLANVLGSRFSDMNGYASDVTTASYVMIMMLGIFLFTSALIRQLKLHRAKAEHNHDEHHEHQHEDACCGGHHTHQSTPQETLTKSIGVIFSMGLRPCAGAIVVLIYAHLVDAFFYGILATLMMGLGTGLSISAIALATQLVRNRFEQFAYSKNTASTFHAGRFLRMAGGIVIFLLGLSLYQAATQTLPGSHPLM
jgi:ABC-type nickel/cobalt efflux system permease component RcnA